MSPPLRRGPIVRPSHFSACFPFGSEVLSRRSRNTAGDLVTGNGAGGEGVQAEHLVGDIRCFVMLILKTRLLPTVRAPAGSSTPMPRLSRSSTRNSTSLMATIADTPMLRPCRGSVAVALPGVTALIRAATAACGSSW